MDHLLPKAILLWRIIKWAKTLITSQVQGAAPMQDCPLRKTSASTFSFGVNPPAMSLLKISLQVLKLPFSCSRARYLPRVFPCRQRYSARETFFPLNIRKKMHGSSSCSSQRGGDPTAPRSLQLPLPMGNEIPIFGGILKLQRANPNQQQSCLAKQEKAWQDCSMEN